MIENELISNNILDLITIISGYVFSIDGHSTKMRFPKDDRVDLCIVQHFLVL